MADQKEVCGTPGTDAPPCGSRDVASVEATAALTTAWSGGKCRVPMWMGGMPAGFCGDPANGPQLPPEVLSAQRGWPRGDAPYCFGPCCPGHGGPRDGEPILFEDGLTERGYRMWCAVMPDFINLQESPAGFDGDGRVAIAKLKTAIAKALGGDA